MRLEKYWFSTFLTTIIVHLKKMFFFQVIKANLDEILQNTTHRKQTIVKKLNS